MVLLVFALAGACHMEKWRIVSAGGDESTFVRSMRMLSSTHGWAVSSRGGLLETTDGGRTWSERSPGAATWYSAIDFAGDAGFVGGGKLQGSSQDQWARVLLKTADGGGHWQEIDLPNLGSVALVSACGAQVAWLSADKGGARTEDGGRTWTVVSLPTRAKPTALKCASRDTAFVVGTDGWVARTRDGGLTWFETQPAAGRILAGVVATDGQVWVVGEAGTLLTSADGGDRFQPVHVGKSEFLADIAFNGQRGYIVGARGLILETLDAGATWRAVASPTTMDLYCASTTANGGAWVGGGKWTILQRYPG